MLTSFIARSLCLKLGQAAEESGRDTHLKVLLAKSVKIAFDESSRYFITCY